MIDNLKSVRDVWGRLPSEHHARLFLEDTVYRSDCFSISPMPSLVELAT